VIRATLPDVDVAALERLPGASRAERHGEAVVVTCSDSDAAIRALLLAYPVARDIEIGGAGLEAAFLGVTGGDHEGAAACSPRRTSATSSCAPSGTGASSCSRSGSR